MNPCPHNSADPKMCPACRDARLAAPLTASLAPMLADSLPLAVQLADTLAPGRVIGLSEVDHAAVLAADLQRMLGRIRYVALTWEDAAALLHAARRNGRLPAPVAVRVSEALSEALSTEPGLLTSANAEAGGSAARDHEGDEIHHLKNPPLELR